MDKLVISNLLRSIMNKSRESMEQRVKDMDISPQQGRMISYIVQNEDKGLIQKDLAEVFQRRGASITSMLQGLEKKGYIERRIPENNERQKNIFVLPKGKALVDETNEAFYAAEKELVHALNEDEVQQLTELLRKIDRSLLVNKQQLLACNKIVRSLTFKNLIKEGIIMEEFEVNESNIYYLKKVRFVKPSSIYQFR